MKDVSELLSGNPMLLGILLLCTLMVCLVLGECCPFAPFSAL